jgi:hypothetical protein
MQSKRHEVMKSPDVKTIGSSGQISLGKEFAGQTVTVEQVEAGVWIVKAARVIPENELWLHTPEMSRKLTQAIQWAEEHPAKESDLGALERKLKNRKRP